MPLSEHEQRLLEQMEKALYAEDPKFATSLRDTSGTRPNRGRATLGIVALLLGVLVLMVGAVTGTIVIGVLGFAVMLLGALLAYAGFRAKAPAADAAEGNPRHPSSKRAKPGFGSRLEDRWRRRRDGEV